MIGDFETVRKGLDWFAENYPHEYFVLLDWPLIQLVVQ
jgi:hypothetical protein